MREGFNEVYNDDVHIAKLRTTPVTAVEQDASQTHVSGKLVDCTPTLKLATMRTMSQTTTNATYTIGNSATKNYS